MPRALMAVAPRTTELVEYEEPPLGDRAQQHAGVGQPVPRPSAVGRPPRQGDRLHLMREGRLQSDGLVHPIVAFEQSAEAYRWIQCHPDRVVRLGIRFP